MSYHEDNTSPRIHLNDPTIVPMRPDALNEMDRRAMKRRQVGGDHYEKHKIQPFHVIDDWGLDFYEGNALKYLARHKDKNGKQDLEKAIHYITEVIKRYYPDPPFSQEEVRRAYEMPGEEEIKSGTGFIRRAYEDGEDE
jgi:hypothetical protein